MAEFEEEASIGDYLLGPLEAGVELALPSNAGASIVEAPVVESGVSIGLSTLSFELDDIVFVVDGVGVDVGALH